MLPGGPWSLDTWASGRPTFRAFLWLRCGGRRKQEGRPDTSCSSLMPGGHLQPAPVPQGQTWFQQRTCPEPGLPTWLPLGHVPDQLLPQEAISEACPSPAMSWEVETRVLGALDRGRVGKWPPPRGQRGSCPRHSFFGAHYLNPTQPEETHPSRELWSPHLQAEETALVLPGFGWLGSGQRSTHE